jgi:hypothetical protein
MIETYIWFIGLYEGMKEVIELRIALCRSHVKKCLICGLSRLVRSSKII